MRQREELEFQILQLPLAVGVLNVLKRRRVVQSLDGAVGKRKTSSSRSQDEPDLKLGKFRKQWTRLYRRLQPSRKLRSRLLRTYTCVPICERTHTSPPCTFADIDPILSFSRISVHLRRHIKDSARPLEMGR